MPHTELRIPHSALAREVIHLMNVKVAPAVRELLESDDAQDGFDALAELWREVKRRPLSIPVRGGDVPAAQTEAPLRVRFSRD